MKTLTGHSNTVWCVAVFSDCSRIVSGSDDMSVKIWDAKTGTNLMTLTGHSDYVRGVAVFRDGTRIVSGSNDKSVRVWGMVYYPAKSVFILLKKMFERLEVTEMGIIDLITKYCITPKYELEALWKE